MWQRIRSLIVKELLAVWRDPKSRAILFIPPMFQLLIFSFAATQEVKNVRIAVLNRDQGTSSRDLIARFEGSSNFSSVRYLRDERELARAIDSRSVLMAIHFQSDFSRLVTAGEPASGAVDSGRPPLERRADWSPATRPKSFLAMRPNCRSRGGRCRRPAWWCRDTGSTPTSKAPGTPCPRWSRS